MTIIKEIICIQCPLACRVKLHLDDKGVIEDITDWGCKEGKKHVQQEYESPRRVLTTTVRTNSSTRPVLPVRSQGAIPKDMLGQCVRFLADVKVKAPLKMGDVVVPDILNSGVNIVCTDDLPY
jgi:CxxC motif-containing protein